MLEEEEEVVVDDEEEMVVVDEEEGKTACGAACTHGHEATIITQ